jgi:hypothetical protein
MHRTFESELLCEWEGKRKVFLKRIVAESTPERYLANLSSRILGWMDRDTQWMCEAGELVSFSEGNGEQEALVVLPPYGWVSISRQQEAIEFLLDGRAARPAP